MNQINLKLGFKIINIVIENMIISDVNKKIIYNNTQRSIEGILYDK